METRYAKNKEIGPRKRREHRRTKKKRDLRRTAKQNQLRRKHQKKKKPVQKDRKT